MDIYCIGEILVDFLPGENDDEYIRKAGGAPANVAAVCTTYGLEAGFCGKVGDDDFGQFLENALKKKNVRILCEEKAKTATTMAFVSLSEEGERSFIFVRNPGADTLLNPADVKKEDIASSFIIHAGSCSLSAEPQAAATVKALMLGHELEKIITFDINYRDLMWSGRKDKCVKKVKDLLPLIDFLKVSEEEADMLGGEDNFPGILKDYSLGAIVLTLGRNGAKAYFADGVIYSEAKKVSVVDTTGAGDAFWGAFLSSLIIQGLKKPADITADMLKRALDEGSCAGAMCVQKRGAFF